MTIADGGEYFETLDVRTRTGSPGYFLGIYPDGSLLFWRTGFERRSDGSRSRYEDMIRTRPTSADEPWPEDTLFFRSWDDPGERTPNALFRARGTGGIHPEGAWFTSGTDPEIRLYGTDGSLRRIVRWSESDRTATPERVEFMINSALENVPADRRAESRRVIEDLPVPGRFPSTVGARSEMSGRAWVFRLELPGEELAGEILLFSPDGRLEARIDYWEGVEPMPRGLETVLMRGGDEFGAPRLTRHRSERVDAGG